MRDTILLQMGRSPTIMYKAYISAGHEPLALGLGMVKDPGAHTIRIHTTNMPKEHITSAQTSLLWEKDVPVRTRALKYSCAGFQTPTLDGLVVLADAPSPSWLTAHPKAV